ncbi:MAG: amidophosphoribosyltransferase, partial [Pseudomonadota bacterium]
IDDSIVRGTTSKKIVKMVRDAGAKEIHFRSASPPIRHPDFYGIDMPSEDELFAACFSIEEMTEQLGVDSLRFLSVDGLYKAIDEKPRDNDAPNHADHCFTGDYPTDLTDHKAAKSAKEQQLSLLLD